MDQYRDASNELGKMKMTLNQFETEVSNLKIELQMKQTENKRLRERIDLVEKDNHKVFYILEFQAFQTKLIVFFGIASKLV